MTVTWRTKTTLPLYHFKNYLVLEGKRLSRSYFQYYVVKINSRYVKFLTLGKFGFQHLQSNHVDYENPDRRVEEFGFIFNKTYWSHTLGFQPGINKLTIPQVKYYLITLICQDWFVEALCWYSAEISSCRKVWMAFQCLSNHSASGIISL